jgi:hypothetical protein
MATLSADRDGERGARPGKLRGREAEMRCTRCDGDAMVTIRMTIADQEITFRHCPDCERNEWRGGAGELSLERVLALARAGR